jgi:hypothetical protein
MFHYIVEKLNHYIVEKLNYYIVEKLNYYIVEKLNIGLILNKTRNLLNNFLPLDEYYTVLESTNNYYQISQNLSLYKNHLDSFLTSKTLIGLYSRFTLMESLLLCDGVVCSVYFLREFLILKLSCRKLSKGAIMVYNEEIVEKYNSLYRLSTLDRYVFYLLIYFGYNTINYFYEENQYSYLLILPIVLPSLQNSLLGISFISKSISNYVEHKDIFVKYSMSKMSVHFVQQLHPQIEKIQNYHIFIIYKTLSVNFVWKITNNCLFIALLNVLRSYDSTYYYYKGIKMAYYYNVGYLYNIIPLGDAIYLANIIIKEKRWRELEKLEVVNAFFTLVVNKYEIFTSFSGSFWINSQMILFQLFSLYSIVSVLKLITIYLSGTWVCGLLMTVAVYLAKLNVKNIITSILVYFLIIFNINDLIITLVIITHKIVYYWLEEVYFFVKNTKNVKKVIKMYETPSREAMVSKIRDEYTIC